MAEQYRLIHPISFSAHWPEVTLLERDNMHFYHMLWKSAKCATAINGLNESRLEDQFYLC